MHENHTIMIGPKSCPMAAVPRRLDGEEADEDDARDRDDDGLELGARDARGPRRRDSTEIAGVMTPSP